MSSQGFFYTPEDQEQLSALQRKQALAQALLKQGGGDPGSAAYGGVASAGRSILGAFLSNRFNDQENKLTKAAAGRYSQDLGTFLGGGQGAMPAGHPPMPVSQPVTGASPQPQVSPVAGAPPQQPMAQPQAAPAAQPGSMAALLATHNPGLIQQYAPELLKTQLGREQKLWENTLPLSQAERDQAGLNLQNQEGLSQFNNKLPATAYQQAELGLSRATQGEAARHNRVEENIAQNPFSTGLGVPGAAGKMGDDFLATLPPGVAAQIKAVGTYRQPAPAGRTSPTGIKFMTLVNQAYPDYDATQYTVKSHARNAFATGAQGKSILAINNAMAHLNLLGQLADAMHNGNIPLVNQISNAYSQATGQSAPTNFDAVKNIAAQEVVKSVVPGGGGEAERQAAAQNFSRAGSPDQIHGAINGVRGLFAGQLGNYKRQYEKLTGLRDFGDYLSPDTAGLMNAHPTEQSSGPPKGGGSQVIRYDASGNRIP